MFIVIEGIDGSGKSTQHEILVKYLKEKGKQVKVIKFPRHGKPFFGNVVDDYLENKFGSASKIDPHLASMIFALDRLEVKEEILKSIEEGYVFIPDRYESNLGHQLGKMINKSDKEKDEFINWETTMEYKALKLPKPDLVIYLHLDFDVTVRLLTERGRMDGHESDHEYLKNSQTAYDYVCKKIPYWTRLDCTTKDGKNIKTIEEIHKEIIKLIERKFPELI